MVRFRELDLLCKLGVIGGLISFVIFVSSFLLGFFSGFLAAIV